MPPSVLSFGSFDQFCLGYRTLCVNHKQLYIYIYIFYFRSFILVKLHDPDANIDEMLLFINVANVYLTHNLPMNLLMCLSSSKYADI